MRKIRFLFGFFITIGSLWAQTNTNVAPSATIITTVTSFGFGDSIKNMRVLVDGEKDSDHNDSIANLRDADEKSIAFAWPSKFYNNGRFVLYNKGSQQDRIDSSTVAFFQGEDRVYIDTILNAGDTVTIFLPTDSMFNKVVLIFWGDTQNIREIEIFGTDVTPTVESVEVSILEGASDSILKGDTITLEANVSVTNGASEVVTWTSSDADVATVSSTGEVVAIDPGTATITATSTVDGTKTDTVTITVMSVDSITITGADTVWIDSTITLMAEVYVTNGADQTVIWSSSDINVATVTSSGVVTAVAEGTATITATSTVDASITGSLEITVPAPTVESVSISILEGASDSILKGDTINLMATVSAKYGASETVTWTTSNADVAIVDASTGEVVGVSGGTANIIATSTVDGTKTDTVTIRVSSVNSVTITGENSVWIDSTITLNVMVDVTNNAPQTVEWTSESTDIVMVNPSTGVVTGVAPGTANIIATSTVDFTITDTFEITVPALSVDSVFITGVDSVLRGTTITLMVNVFVTNGASDSVTWSSSDPSIATVSSLGVVRGIRVRNPGTAIITATSVADTTKTASKIITVRAVNRIETTGHDTVFVEGTTTLTAIVIGTNIFQAMKWTSSDTSKATVDSLGVVTGKATGTVNIIVTSTVDTTKADTVAMTVLIQAVTGVSITGDGSIWVGNTSTFSATVIGTAPQTVIWSSSDPDIATVDSLGVVTTVSVGEVDIKATSTADTTKTAKKTIAIIPVQTNNIAPDANITKTFTQFYQGSSASNISWITDGVKNSDDIGTTLVHPTGADGKKFTFAWSGKLYTHGRFVLYNRVDCCSDRINSSTVAFFHGADRVYMDTILNAGDTITIVPDFAVEFNKIVLTFSGDDQNFREIEVFGTATPTIVDSVTIAGRDTAFAGKTLSLTAKVVGTNAPQTVTWNTSNSSVAIVSSVGVVTGLSVGIVTITATSTHDNTKIGTKILTVTPPPIVNSISITGADSVLIGESIALTAEVSVTNGAPQTVTWSSNNINVAYVNALGEVVGFRKGTVTITATSTYNNTKKATKTITVVDEADGTSVLYLNKVNLENSSMILYNTLGERIKGSALQNLKEGVYLVQEKGSNQFTKVMIR